VKQEERLKVTLKEQETKIQEDLHELNDDDNDFNEDEFNNQKRKKQ
jgi:archaellum component FlaC